MMQSKVVLHIRNPFLLDASTYVSTAVMALLGISGLQNLTLQIIALALCLTFALLYRFLFRTGYYERNPAVYFGGQIVVLVLLFLLNSGASDAFNFLFYILTFHTAVVLTIRTAAAWIAFYFLITSSVSLISRGWDGLYAVFFYLAVFIVCAILGNTVQQTELTSERNQRLVDELKEAQQKVQELAVVDERNRLARDLHDSVKQQVFAISMQLSAAKTSLSETDKAYSSVAEAERLAQQAGAELTTLIHELRPPPLERKTLAAGLQDYVTEWSRQNNIEISINIDKDLSLSVNEEQTLFRVIQEALSNIARHSHAANAIVELIQVDSDILLCIADTGQGFDTNLVPMGVGLHSMRERLMQIGGTFHLLSGKDVGTQIIAKLRRA
jgi:two-component system, NarL family, sensor histidine kinase LiaS